MFYGIYYWVSITREDILQYEPIIKEEKTKNLLTPNEWLGHIWVKEEEIHGWEAIIQWSGTTIIAKEDLITVISWVVICATYTPDGKLDYSLCEV